MSRTGSRQSRKSLLAAPRAQLSLSHTMQLPVSTAWAKTPRSCGPLHPEIRRNVRSVFRSFSGTSSGFSSMALPAAKPILLIDDDALQLRIRQAVLQSAGFMVDTATTAEAALALLQPGTGRDFAAVVTDHVLSAGSGAELVPQIRALLPSLPIVVVTGMPGAEGEYSGQNVVFRQKPVLPEELIALIKSVTQRTDLS